MEVVRSKTQIAKQLPCLVAIVGGSGAGKTWLAQRLQQIFGENAARLSLDDFYRDRSHLNPGQRNRINFDHPRAIDWNSLESVLNDCVAGRKTLRPIYDFTTHARMTTSRVFKPKPLILVEGLWLLRKPSIRRLFCAKIFIDCPKNIRFERRLARDSKERGRSHTSILEQFRTTVSPMHQRFVATQKQWADVVIKHPFGETEIQKLARQLQQFISNNYD